MNFRKFLDKENSVANDDYNRWWLLPSALSIHLCIGQIYAFSVFNEPLTRIIGIEQSVESDWKLTQIGWIFSLALIFLGASAALFGKWVEKSGPRKAMFVSSLLFSSGFLISALGVWFHEIILLYVGSGVLGGIGLGLGYISPVSTLMKWFPDRPGMATGMAIMGFGGGAMIASPLSVYLMDIFSSENGVGVFGTFICLGVLYFIVMNFGTINVRVAPDGYKKQSEDLKSTGSVKQVKAEDVTVDKAIKTPQFYLLFAVLLLNVTAGIGVLGQASVMIQEMFSEKSVGAENAVSAVEAAGFVGLLSFFNMIGRFIWSSLSDYIGRKNTYSVFFTLGTILFLTIPFTGELNSPRFFVISFCIIMSMYGGGFATIPAYLRDNFGTMQVGAIHGRILLAWSVAAILGPVIINYMREYQIETLNIPASQVYSTTMYIMAGLLVIGLVCNLMIKKVDPRYYFINNPK